MLRSCFEMFELTSIIIMVLHKFNHILFILEKLYVFPCGWNLRPEHCSYGLTCDSADTNGASIIHGSRRVYHTDEEPAFKAVYDGFLQVAS